MRNRCNSLGVSLAVLLALSACGPKPSSRRPRFEDYPVADILTEAPVAPEHPVGPDNIKKEVNFAGHYMVDAWAPGGNPLVLDIIDAKTGHVFVPPLFPKRFVSGVCPNCIPSNATSNWGGAYFRLNSRLMILNDVCPGDKPMKGYEVNAKNCGRYYFVWENGTFRWLR